MHLRSGVCLVAMAILAGVHGAAMGEEPPTVPYRRTTIRIDGDLGDWAEPFVTIDLREPEPAPDPNTVRVHLAWDREWLYTAFDVTDGRLVPPPDGVHPAGLYQGDSVELYVDGRGNRSAMMDADDFQFLVACDGRSATLQGDPILARLKILEVPKVERPSPGIRSAVRIRNGGYTVEMAVPLASILAGRSPHRAVIAYDVAVNDWDRRHPAVGDVTLDDLIEAARSELRGEEVPGEEGPDPFEKARTLGYLPWSLCNGRDFGHPATWRLATLSGSPPWPERLTDRFGVARTIGAAVLATAVAWLALLTLQEIRHRRRVRALLERLEPRPAPGAVRAPETPSSTGTDAIRDPVVRKAVALVREQLGEPLGPGELATAVHVSLRTLQRALDRELHCTPRELIVGSKMRAAREMLASGEYRVNEVATRVGFADPAHFSRRYKAYFGESPSRAIPGRS